MKEFLLKQPEADEVKISDHVFRRPGDTCLDQVIKEKLQNKEEEEEEDNDDDAAATAPKQEL